MPVFHHVDAHHGPHPTTIVRRRGAHTLYFGPHDGVFATMFKRSGMAEHGGYVVYRITIPPKRYTESMNPRTKKVVRVTPRNLAKYKALVKQGHMSRNKNILGFDLTRITNRHYKGEPYGALGSEGWLYEIPRDIKVEVYAVFSCDACR